MRWTMSWWMYWIMSGLLHLFQAQKAKDKEENEQLIDQLDKEFTSLVHSEALVALTQPNKMNALKSLINKSSSSDEPKKKEVASSENKASNNLVNSLHVLLRIGGPILVLRGSNACNVWDLVCPDWFVGKIPLFIFQKREKKKKKKTKIFLMFFSNYCCLILVSCSCSFVSFLFIPSFLNFYIYTTKLSDLWLYINCRKNLIFMINL